MEASFASFNLHGGPVPASDGPDLASRFNSMGLNGVSQHAPIPPIPVGFAMGMKPGSNSRRRVDIPTASTAASHTTTAGPSAQAAGTTSRQPQRQPSALHSSDEDEDSDEFEDSDGDDTAGFLYGARPAVRPTAPRGFQMPSAVPSSTAQPQPQQAATQAGASGASAAPQAAPVPERPFAAFTPGFLSSKAKGSKPKAARTQTSAGEAGAGAGAAAAAPPVASSVPNVASAPPAAGFRFQPNAAPVAGSDRFAAAERMASEPQAPTAAPAAPPIPAFSMGAKKGAGKARAAGVSAAAAPTAAVPPPVVPPPVVPASFTFGPLPASRAAAAAPPVVPAASAIPAAQAFQSAVPPVVPPVIPAVGFAMGQPPGRAGTKAVAAPQVPPATPAPATSFGPGAPVATAMGATFLFSSPGPVASPGHAKPFTGATPPGQAVSQSPSTAASTASKSALAIARERFAKHDFAGARSAFTDALKAVPGQPAALGNRAACSMMLGEYESALEDTKKAVELDKTYVPAYGRMARAHLALGDAHAAQACLRTVSTLSSEMLSSGASVKYEGVLAELHELHDSLNSAMGCVDAAVGHLKRHAGALARASLDRAKEHLGDIDRTFHFAHVAILMKCTHERDYAGAIEDFTTVLPECLEGSNAKLAHLTSATVSAAAVDVAALLGWAAWAGEDPDKADRVLASVLRANPKHPVASILHRRLEPVERYKRLGNRSFAAQEWTDAVRHYDLALQALSLGGPATDALTNTQLLVPAIAAALHSNKAAALSADGRNAAAISAASAALTAWPGHVKAKLRRARARLAEKDWTGARQDFQAVLNAIRDGQQGAGKAGRTDATQADVQKELASVSVAERQAEAAAADERRRRQQAYANHFHSHDYDYDDDYGGEEEEDDEQEYWSGFGGYGFFGHSSGYPRGSGRAGGGRSTYTAPKPAPIPPKPADHYSVLGVARGCSADVLKAAYKKAALRTHPDKGGDAKAFQAVSLAYETLSNALQLRQWEADSAGWERRYGRR